MIVKHVVVSQLTFVISAFSFASFPVCAPLPFTLVSSVSRLIQMRKKLRFLPYNNPHWDQVNTKLGTLPLCIPFTHTKVT